MEEIEKIITAISEVTGLDRFSIISGRTDECKRARGILCYIALRDRYGLTTILSETLEKSRSQCIFMTDFCTEEMEESIGFLIIMNEIRKKLGMSAIMTDKIEQEKQKQKERKLKEDEEKSDQNAKILFNITYSESEKKYRREAIKNATAFMNKYCQLGQKVKPEMAN